jgi:hypothetical protein
MNTHLPNPVGSLAAACCLALSTFGAWAVPVAVDDTYTATEDTPLQATGAATVYLDAPFEAGANLATGNWDYLQVPNHLAPVPGNGSYPVDGDTAGWKDAAFNKTTSSIAGWAQSPMPIQGGGVDGLAGAAVVLDVPALTSGAGSQYIYTTYLFRKSITLNAAQVAAGLTASVICDDGIVLYTNGTESGRVNMATGSFINPAGAPEGLSTLTGTANGNENTTYSITIPASQLVVGANQIAIELHQAATNATTFTSSDAGIGISISTPGGDPQSGFTGVNDAFFGTVANNGFNTGRAFAYQTAGGVGGTGGVEVSVGGNFVFNGTGNTGARSAGWRRTFTVAEAGMVELKFSQRMVFGKDYDVGEWSEVIADIDGTQYGTITAPGTHKSVAFRQGDGNGGANYDSGFLPVTLQMSLTAGTHTLTLGAYNNTSQGGGGGTNESTEAWFDNVTIKTLGAAPGVLANDTGGPTSATVVTGPTHGSVVFAADGTFTYTPHLNYNGTDSFTYTANDAGGSSAPATATITIAAVNDAPVGTPDLLTVDEDGSVAFTTASLVANDVDPEGNAITISGGTNPARGSITTIAANSFSYAPAPNFFGTDSFTYIATDGTANSTPITVTISVLPLPDAPVAVEESYTVPFNGSLTITDVNGSATTEQLILGTERDANGQVIVTKGSIWKYYSAAAAPVDTVAVPWTSLAFDDSLWPSGESELGYGDAPAGAENRPEGTLIPDDDIAGYAGGNVPRYITSYFRKTLSIANISEITALNLQVLRDDGILLYINNTPAFRSNLTANPTYSTLAGLSTSAANEAAFLDASVLGTNGESVNLINVAPTPALLVEGNNIFAAEVHNSSSTSTDLSFDVKFSISRFTNRGLLQNDTDADGDSLTAILVTNAAHGNVTVNPNGSFTYTPTAGYLGPDSFTYKANDGALDSNIATVNLTVANVANTKPTAVANTYAASEDTTLTVPAATGVLVNDTDPDNDVLTAILVTNVTRGTLALSPDGSFIYTPTANYSGPDSFTYRCQDTALNFSANNATVTINVAPVNDAPVAVADSYSTEPSVTLNVPLPGVLGNDTDIDNLSSALTATVVTNPSAGALTLNGNGGFTYIPAGTGTFTFTYTTSDGTNTSAPATVTILVKLKPQAVADSYTTAEDTTLNIAAPGLLANDTDPDSLPLTAIKVTNPANGTVVVNSNGSFSYQPVANYNGPDSFTYKVNNGSIDSTPGTVSITVTSLPDAPVAVADTYGVLINQTLTTTAANGVLNNDTDADAGSTLTATKLTDPAHGTLNFLSDGSFVYTPAAEYVGADSFTYQVSDGSLVSTAATVTLDVAADAKTVIINEIMYNPPGTTGDTEEFIEITNTGTFQLNLTGWQFTKGVNFTFPNGTVLPAGGYLVIPANAATFHVKYPAVTAYLDPGWGTLSGLSNGGETIRLVNALGETVDEVSYSSEGEWATRRIVNVWDQSNSTSVYNPLQGLDTDPSLEYYTTANPDPEVGNAGGASIQLKQVQLSNNQGQNWTAATPTPGASNSTVVANSAPLITNVKHFPPVPDRTQQVHVTAQLEDESLTGVTASVFYRTTGASVSTANTAAFTEVAMSDLGTSGDGAAGDGEYGATLPAQALGTVVEFYVRARDAALNPRTWPAPTQDINGANEVQNANCLYQVDETPWTDERPLYRMVMTGNDNYRYDVSRWSSSSNEGLNTTFIVRQGQDYDIRYGCSLRIRGNSSRSWNPRNWRFDIPGDRVWNGRSGFMLNSKYTYSQLLASRLAESAGVPCEKANIVGVRLNGVNHATDAQQASMHGYYADMVPFGGELINDVFPNDSAGNGYRKIRGGGDWGTGSTPVINANGYAAGGLMNNGWSKKGNSAANDWSDLSDWLNVMNSSTTATFHTDVANNVDLDEWARWWALCTIVNHAETNPANGDDDDYSTYFGADRRCKLIPHDFDTCFNLQAISLGDSVAPPTTTIYQATDGTYVTGPTIPIMAKFYQNNVTNRKFKAALRHNLDTIFTKPRFDALVDSLLDNNWMGTSYTPTGPTIRTHIKSFMDARRTTIETFLPTAFTATTTLTVTNGFPRTTSATNLGALGGAIDPVKTAKVTVNGITVTHSNFGNNWAAGTAITLHPGLNPMLCEAWDESNALVASQTITIWYDATAATKSSLTGSETWTAAGGPYSVPASISVPNGTTLTIEAGATIYMGSAADLTVAAGGRIVAVGTSGLPITFTRLPSATTTWGGVLINGTTAQPSRLSYVIFDQNNDIAVHTQNGANVELDHLTFLNPAKAFISLDASSFIVSDCIFPTPTTGFEPLHGTGGIAAGGHGIIRNCVFGLTQGYFDTIDFTGGNRPGPILHILNNVFNGSGDDVLDLDSTDAWVEGNVFLHVHKNGSPDSASAVSGGDDNGSKSEITVIRNLIYDCDNAITTKQGNSFSLLYNTIAHITKTGGTETESGVLNFADTTDGSASGAGGIVIGNIITDVESLTRQYYPATNNVTFNNNIIPLAWSGAGTGNRVIADPMLNLALITTPATATADQVRAALAPQSCSPAVGAGFGGVNQGASAPAGILAQGLPPLVTGSTSVNLTFGPAVTVVLTSLTWQSGYTAYQWKLDAGSYSAETPIATPLSLTGLTAGAHTISLLGKTDGGEWQTAPTVYPFTIQAGLPTVVISEVLADNPTSYVLGTTHPDVIELHNYGTSAVSLAGLGLSDDPTAAFKYAFPAGTTLAAGERLVLIADSLVPQAGEIHLGFGLSADGETLTLTAPGAVPTTVDTVTFGQQLPNYSISRTGARYEWTLSTPTIGIANLACQDLTNGSTLRINEWLATNDYVITSDFLELYNPATKPVALGGWRLSTDHINAPAEHIIAPLTFIPAGGFILFKADAKPLDGPNHLTFAISKTHESLALLDPTGNRVDFAMVTAGVEDKSQGLLFDGGNGVDGNNFGYFTVPTPGFSNNTSLTAEIALRNGLRITEMMYNPSSNSRSEYVEFKNIGANTLNLAGVHFTNGIDFTFPPGFTLAAGAYAVIVGEQAKFLAQFPTVPVAGVYTGKLSNGGDRLRYEVANYAIGILDFNYADDWYPVTDGAGASLQIVDSAAAPGSWDEKPSWQAGAASPGQATAFGVLAGPDLSVISPIPVVIDGTVFYGNFTAGEVTFAWTQLSGPGLTTFTAPANPDTNATFSLPGIYELQLTATGPGAVTTSDSVVVTVVENYDSWTTAQFPGNTNPGTIGQTADPDNDGIPNLVEFALNLNPHVNSQHQLPKPISENGMLTLNYQRLIAPGLSYVVEVSDELGNWQATANETWLSTAGNMESWQAQAPAPMNTQATQFMRIRVNYTP